ncbi:hypothetical protein DICVIV_03851 [Dictyocaulus viviparus]|uniref:Uncharacterized protein n=1 Tax=Dictyocaulus viviparus TaxID=29172 RepID=A0A0D8XZ95_DICVI|nr:hypothetical protein DICVIV_03851 [Dictyocaulus viviparus]
MERGIDDRVDSDIDESTAFSTCAIKASDEQASQHTYEPIEEDSVAEQSPVMNEMAPGRRITSFKSKDIDMETDNIPSTSKYYDEPVAEIKESERGQHQETFEEVELMDGEASVDEILSTFYPD